MKTFSVIYFLKNRKTTRVLWTSNECATNEPTCHPFQWVVTEQRRSLIFFRPQTKQNIEKHCPISKRGRKRRRRNRTHEDIHPHAAAPTASNVILSHQTPAPRARTPRTRENRSLTSARPNPVRQGPVGPTCQ
jgi:hypothetical protein